MDISEPSFAPTDLTDGRNPGDWKSRYRPKSSQDDDGAYKSIRLEAIYLAVLLAASPTFLFLTWNGCFAKILSLGTDPHATLVFKRAAYAWIGGTLGGTLFAIKWLYHGVAKYMWNLDRRLWRLFAPHLSGGLAFAVVFLVSSGTLTLFDQHSIESPIVGFGIAFMVGYFSDSATAKLTELAETLFGKSRQSHNETQQVIRRRRTKPRRRPTPPKSPESVVTPSCVNQPIIPTPLP